MRNRYQRLGFGLLAFFVVLAIVRLLVDPSQPSAGPTQSARFDVGAPLEYRELEVTSGESTHAHSLSSVASLESRGALSDERGKEVRVLWDTRFPQNESGLVVQGTIDLQLIDAKGLAVAQMEVQISQNVGYIPSWPKSACAYKVNHSELVRLAGSKRDPVLPIKSTGVLGASLQSLDLVVLEPGIYAYSTLTGRALNQVWVNRGAPGATFRGPAPLAEGGERTLHAVPVSNSDSQPSDRVYIGAPGHGWVRVENAEARIGEPVIVNLGPAGTVLLDCARIRAMATRAEFKYLEIGLSPAGTRPAPAHADGRIALQTTLDATYIANGGVLRWQGINPGTYHIIVQVPESDRVWGGSLMVSPDGETVVDDEMLGILEISIRSVQLSFEYQDDFQLFEGIEANCGGMIGSGIISGGFSKTQDEKRSRATFERRLWGELSNLDLLLAEHAGMVLFSNQTLRILPWGVNVATAGETLMPDGLLVVRIPKLEWREISVLVDGSPCQLREASISYWPQGNDRSAMDRQCLPRYFPCPRGSESSFRFVHWPRALPEVKLVLGSAWDHQPIPLTGAILESGVLSLETPSSRPDYIYLAFAASGVDSGFDEARGVLERARFANVEGGELLGMIKREKVSAPAANQARGTSGHRAQRSRPKVYQDVWRIEIPQAAHLLYLPGRSPSEPPREIPVRALIDAWQHVGAEDPLILWP
jgi:hypothetical protein